MKRVGMLLFLLITLPIALRAQSLTPEFELRLHYSDPGGGGGTSLGPIGFGYDPRAITIVNDTMSFGIDTAFGMMRAPLSPGFGSGNFFIGFQIDDEDASLIDIVHKPDTSTFTLQYELYVSPFKFPGTLSWNPATIPALVDSIIITPNGAPSLKMGDMVRQSSVSITANISDPNYYGNWNPAILTLYYNTQAPASVNGSTANGAILSSLQAYPNPMSAAGKLSFVLSQPSEVTVAGFDIAGRELFRAVRTEPAGSITTDIPQLNDVHGAVLIRLDAESGSEHETQTTVVVRE